MNGVGQQGDTATPVHDRDLQHGGEAQQRQCNPDRANAFIGRRKGRVGNQCVLLIAVPVQMEDRREKPPYSDTMAMSVVVAVWMGMGVIVLVGMRMSVIMC